MVIHRVGWTGALERCTELDEKYTFGSILAALKPAEKQGALQGCDRETIARLLLGATTRGGMLIANAEDPSGPSTPWSSLRELLAGLATERGHVGPAADRLPLAARIVGRTT